MHAVTTVTRQDLCDHKRLNHMNGASPGSGTREFRELRNILAEIAAMRFPKVERRGSEQRSSAIKKRR